MPNQTIKAKTIVLAEAQWLKSIEQQLDRTAANIAAHIRQVRKIERDLDKLEAKLEKKG